MACNSVSPRKTKKGIAAKACKRFETLVESKAGILERIGFGKVKLALYDDCACLRLLV
ncbi:hypothetical protein [Thermococcus sp.]|uniref:hypothetical protein n=1 Tax=Thermococcus sp. TaxID=35749 RepID=UPI002611A814|nr:hypothetical protein [Thermococcus sp.]